MTRAQSCWIFSDELLEHTLEFSIRGLMTLGYLFTNSYVSLSEGHSWSFISQRHTLQSPENICKQTGVGSQKLCIRGLSASDHQGEWSTFNDNYEGKALCAVPMRIKITTRNSSLLPPPIALLVPAELGTIKGLMSGPQSTITFTIDQRHQDRWMCRMVFCVQGPLYPGDAHLSG